MRVRVFTAAALCLAAAPALAQSSQDVTGPLTLTPAMVLCTDLPVTAKPVPRLVVKGPQDLDRVIAMLPGRQLVIARTANDGLAPGQRYITARIHGDEQKFPRPGEGFGDVRITGVVTVQAVDELNAIAQVDMACDSVEAGDFLEPYVEIALPTAATASDLPPDFSDRASVLFGADNRVAVGRGSVTSVDRGTLHGIAAGARFAIYRDRRDGMPLVYLGEAVVMSAGELASKVMITRAVGEISTGDVAVPRRQP